MNTLDGLEVEARRLQWQIDDLEDQLEEVQSRIKALEKSGCISVGEAIHEALRMLAWWSDEQMPLYGRRDFARQLECAARAASGSFSEAAMRRALDVFAVDADPDEVERWLLNALRLESGPVAA